MNKNLVLALLASLIGGNLCAQAPQTVVAQVNPTLEKPRDRSIDHENLKQVHSLVDKNRNMLEKLLASLNNIATVNTPGQATRLTQLKQRAQKMLSNLDKFEQRLNESFKRRFSMLQKMQANLEKFEEYVVKFQNNLQQSKKQVVDKKQPTIAQKGALQPAGTKTIVESAPERLQEEVAANDMAEVEEQN